MASAARAALAVVATTARRINVWHARSFRALFLLDLLGLGLTAWYASAPVPMWQGKLLIVVSVAVGISLWLAFRPQAVIPPRTGYMRALTVPILSAILTLTILAGLREYYSGHYLAVLTAGWTGWMLFVRLTFAWVQPRPRVLVVGSSGHRRELVETGKLDVVRLTRPPEDVDGWDVVLLDPAEAYDPEWLAWLAHADMAGKQIVSAPAMLEMLTGRIAVENLEGRWAPTVFHGRSGYAPFKRLADLIIVLTFSPLILVVAGVVAAAVYLDSGGPVLFWQERIGRNGRPFRMAKFRSMLRDAETNGAAFATGGDRRITRIGTVLRRYRLDEVPQFWNVLRGEMSIVGPRPEQAAFAARFRADIPLYAIRENVRPGITGWAQVMQGYADDAQQTREKLRYDMYYVKHLSLWLDVRIVLETIRTVITGFGSR